MKTIARLASCAALAGTIVPPALFFLGILTLASTQGWMLGAAVLWFAATPVWMAR